MKKLDISARSHKKTRILVGSFISPYKVPVCRTTCSSAIGIKGKLVHIISKTGKVLLNFYQYYSTSSVRKFFLGLTLKLAHFSLNYDYTELIKSSARFHKLSRKRLVSETREKNSKIIF